MNHEVALGGKGKCFIHGRNAHVFVIVIVSKIVLVSVKEQSGKQSASKNINMKKLIR